MQTLTVDYNNIKWISWDIQQAFSDAHTCEVMSKDNRTQQINLQNVDRRSYQAIVKWVQSRFPVLSKGSPDNCAVYDIDY